MVKFFIKSGVILSLIVFQSRHSIAQNMLINGDLSDAPNNTTIAIGSATYWHASHGHTQLRNDNGDRYIQMFAKRCWPAGAWSNNGERNEGVFYDQGCSLIDAGVHYTLEFDLKVTNLDLDHFNIYLSNIVEPNASGVSVTYCGESSNVPQEIDDSEKQIIQVISDIPHDQGYIHYSFSFSAANKFKQIWFYPQNTSDNALVAAQLKNVSLERGCLQEIRYQNRNQLPLFSGASDFILAGSSVVPNLIEGPTVVNPNENIVFSAEGFVELKPGFQAHAHSEFLAKIDQCGSFDQEDEFLATTIDAKVVECEYELSVCNNLGASYQWSHGLGTNSFVVVSPTYPTAYSVNMTLPDGQSRTLYKDITPLTVGEPAFMHHLELFKHDPDPEYRKLYVLDVSEAYQPPFNANFIQMSIYDTWQRLLYRKSYSGEEIDPANMFWDGTNYNGEMVPAGLDYAIVITVENCTGTHYYIHQIEVWNGSHDNWFLAKKSDINSQPDAHVIHHSTLIDVKANNDFFIYPTVSSSFFTLYNSSRYSANVNVVDMAGKIHFSTIIKGETKQEIELQKQGMYLINFYNENKTKTVKIINN